MFDGCKMPTFFMFIKFGRKKNVENNKINKYMRSDHEFVFVLIFG